jgi:hypothetical protein
MANFLRKFAITPAGLIRSNIFSTLCELEKMLTSLKKILDKPGMGDIIENNFQ